MKIKAIEVVEMTTDKVIHTITINPPTEEDSRRLEQVMSGLLMNMDTDRYFAREVENMMEAPDTG